MTMHQRAVFFDHLGDVYGLEALQKTRAFHHAKFWIGSLDTDEESIGACASKSRHIENRMVRMRQLVHCQHSEHGKGGGAENRQFEGDGNECGPAIERAAGNIHGISEYVDPILESKAG